MSITGLKNKDDTQTLTMSEEKKKIDSVLENKNNPEMSEEQENIIKIKKNEIKKKNKIFKIDFNFENNKEPEMTTLKEILKKINIKNSYYIPIKIDYAEDHKPKKKVLDIDKFMGIKKRSLAVKKAEELYGDIEYELLTNHNLKNSNYGIIDIDNFEYQAEEINNLFIEKYPFLKDCYSFTGTTKGLRYLVEYENDINPYYKGTHQKIMKDYDGDWIKDQWWNRLDKEIFSGTQITKITTEQLDLIFNREERVENIIEEVEEEEIVESHSSSTEILEIENEIEDSKDIQEIKEHIKNIDKKYFKNNNDIYKIIYASYRQDNKLKKFVYKLLQPYATNEPKPFEEWFEYLYNKGKNYELLNDKTFKNYSYKSDKLRYFVIKNKYFKDGFIDSTNIKELSKGFIECNKENIIVHTKEDIRDIYIYNEDFKSWKLDLSNKEGKSYGLKGLIDDYVEPYYQSWVFYFKTKLEEENNKEEPDEKTVKILEGNKKEAETSHRKSQGNALTNMVLERVVRDLFNKYNDNNIEFDEKMELLAFQNGQCIDLFTFETKNITKEDYIITKLDYNWIPPEKEEMKQFDEILNSIIDEEDVRNDLLYMFSCALFGYRVEYFFILNGNGRNGKSLLIDIFKQATKGVYYYANTAALQKGIDGGKPDPAIAGIHNKRVIMFGEGESNVKASQSTIKALVGDSVINARGCYSNRTEQRNIGTYILPTNEKPTIDGKLDGETIVNKVRDIKFKNTFTNDPTKLKLPNHYPQNPRFKKPEFITKMKYCFIQKCLNFIKKQKQEYGEDIIYVNWKWSEQVIKDSKAYIQDCDIILTTIKEYYEITEDEKDKVATEKIYERCIGNNNDIIRNPKIYPQYKGFSLKGFRDYMKKHQEFEYQYEAKPTNIDGKIYRNVIKCLKLKDEIKENDNQEYIDSDTD